VAALVLASLVPACSGGADGKLSDVTEAPSFDPRCTHVVDDLGTAELRLAVADPGDVLCFAGDAFAGADLTVKRSGADAVPIVLLGDSTAIHSITVKANYVSVEQFAVTGGDGIVLDGHGLSVKRNTVRDAQIDGISCDGDCTDLLIDGNVVERADGTGISVRGARIAVRNNDVSGSVRGKANDADGMRFFGSDIEISSNRVHDISDRGYASDPPHTDCFQTFDNGGKPPTRDVVIANNRCTNVAHQCLIATAEEAGQAGEVGRSEGIRFDGNTCDVGGSQAVYLSWFPNVEVLGNTFSGIGMDRAVYLENHSTDATLSGNTVTGTFPLVEADASSEPGLQVDEAQQLQQK
jgi:hypothetical protein